MSANSYKNYSITWSKIVKKKKQIFSKIGQKTEKSYSPPQQGIAMYNVKLNGLFQKRQSLWTNSSFPCKCHIQKLAFQAPQG